MKVFINQEEFFTDSNETLETLLLKQGLHSKPGMAVALNHTVISKSNWVNQKLNENDQIMLITATAGG